MWIAYSLISTIALVGRNIVGKLGVDHQDPLKVAWATVTFSLPVAFVSVLLFGYQIQSATFWYLLPIRIIMDVVALLSLLTAFKFKSVTYVVPLLALYPFITLAISYIFQGQTISFVALAGMALIIFSCIFTYFGEKKLTAAADIPNLLKASAFVSVTALLYSILDLLHPVIISHSNTYTYFFISTLIFIVIYSVMLLLKSRSSFESLFENSQHNVLNVLVGLALGFEVLFLFLALERAPAVALVSALRTANIALTVLVASSIFKERFNQAKILGIVGVVFGVLLVVLG